MSEAKQIQLFLIHNIFDRAGHAIQNHYEVHGENLSLKRGVSQMGIINSNERCKYPNHVERACNELFW